MLPYECRRPPPVFVSDPMACTAGLVIAATLSSVTKRVKGSAALMFSTPSKKTVGIDIDLHPYRRGELDAAEPLPQHGLQIDVAPRLHQEAAAMPAAQHGEGRWRRAQRLHPRHLRRSAGKGAGGEIGACLIGR